MKYKILSSNSSEGLSNQVNKYLEDGWTLLGETKVIGGITQDEDNYYPLKTMLYQAITLDD